tara:strand:+ start:64 stop:372 length:309 start_codon:yes stop_codon:yes gene_type:complete
MREILILVTTESNEMIAKNIAKILIKNKLAACVSIKQIFSIYKWEGEIEEANEFEIIIKSKPELKDDLISFIQKVTSYDVPQILYKKFHAESKYHDWLSKTI